MIKATELRIGSLLQRQFIMDGPFHHISIAGIKDKFISWVAQYGPNSPMVLLNDSFKPIPLTPEILEKCGFENGYSVWRKGNFTLEWGGESKCLQFPSGEWRIDMHHLHQLQNLYFAMTDEELNYLP